MCYRFLFRVWIAFAFVLLLVTGAEAQTSVVTSLDATGPGTLWDAVQSAPDGGVITFDPKLAGSIKLNSTLIVSRDLTIVGPSDNGIEISGNSFHSSIVRVDPLYVLRLRHMTVNGGMNDQGIANAGELHLDSCTVMQCFSDTLNQQRFPGGGVFNTGRLFAEFSWFSANTPQAVANRGWAQLTNCTFANNQGPGAAIYNDGVLDVSSCCFIGNHNNGAYLGSETPGGNLVNDSTARLVNCTIANNSVIGGVLPAAQNGTGQDIRLPSFGGGIYNTGSIYIDHCTIVRNTVDLPSSSPPSSGGGIYNAGLLTLENSIVAANGSTPQDFQLLTDIDISGKTTAGGHNFIGELITSDPVLEDPGGMNLFGTPSQSRDPLLGTLAGHGGATDVFSLQANSTAIDEAQPGDSITTDQRGLLRGALPDIGAYERDPMFSTVPIAPVRFKPVDRNTSIDTPLTVSWTPGSGATSFRLQIAYDSGFAQLLVDTSGLDDPTWTGTAMPQGTILFWRAAGVNPLGQSPYSSIGRFRTVGLPGAVQLLTSCGAIADSGYVTLLWRRADRAISYDVAMSWTPASTRDFTTADTSITLGLAAQHVTYTFTITAVNADGRGPSATCQASVDTLPLPSAPPMIAPGDRAVTPLPITFRWNDNRRAKNYATTSFHFQLGRSASWESSSLLVDTSLCCDSSIVIDASSHPPSFLSGSSYYWRVCSVIEGEQGVFTNGSVTIVPSTLLISPGAGTTLDSLPPRLTWQVLEPNNVYRVQVAPDSVMAQPVFDSTSIADSTCVPRNLHSRNTYFWRVQPSGGSLIGSWTSVSSFSVGDTIGPPPPPPPLPTSYVLYGNYPNPFNATTKIRFAIPEPVEVWLRVYAVDGRLVAEIFHQMLPAGSYSIPWDATALASGAYFLQLRAGYNVMVHAAMLLR